MDATPKAQVIANEKNLLSAMKTNNVELLDQLLHDQLLFNGPSGETATKAMDLENYRSGNINLHTIESSDLMLNMVGDDIVVAVTVEIKGNYLGQEIDGKFRYLRVWKLFEKNWKVIAGSVVTLNIGN
ncbi:MULTISPECIES: nuclear transport factor 2 family protein [unclassified Nostoc]|uniref:nuclear transport factor 2 family protein n=1 Tax=unclassified Nostoc TaxID=2593658 RepID=UPI002AD20F52|nr:MULTISPECIES: nuclear transport factor 2 family protein [unclassified Nostoc]MDZ8126158.1 nuclear transport factor 2 family protein [Nostoc sp. CmiVER01]MDZ8221779.1 nuclear transport factor 2 family protein [Nostoc sp. ChiVER01]